MTRVGKKRQTRDKEAKGQRQRKKEMNRRKGKKEKNKQKNYRKRFLKRRGDQFLSASLS